jgi:heptaprenyl diphosphate synthase
MSKPTWGPGPVSYSVIAALFHMFGQFMLAYYWLIPQAGLFKVLPFLLLIALAFGWVNGIMSSLVLNKLENSTPNGHHA